MISYELYFNYGCIVNKELRQKIIHKELISARMLCFRNDSIWYSVKIAEYLKNSSFIK